MFKFQSAGIWSTLTNSANSSLNSLMGIWNSRPSTTVAGPLSPDAAFIPTDVAMSANTTANQNAESLPAFSPFSSDIWSPSASTASTGWQVPTGQPMAGQPDEKEN